MSLEYIKKLNQSIDYLEENICEEFKIKGLSASLFPTKTTGG